MSGFESVTVEVIKDHIKAYEGQFEQAHTQLQQLETNYQQNRTILLNTLNQIKGAIDAFTMVITPAVPEPTTSEQPLTPSE